MTAVLPRWKAEFEVWCMSAPVGHRLRAAWSVHRSLPVRVTGVDVARILPAIAIDVFGSLRKQGVPAGPVLLNLTRGCLEFAVPDGTARTWPALPYSRCVQDAVMRCPAPSVTAASACDPVDGRLWIIPPTPSTPHTTDSDALAEAVGVALCRRAHLLDSYHHSSEAQP